MNALGLRDQTQTIISRTIWLAAYVNNVASVVEARVYSAIPQPIISEVYADNDISTGNLKGYVAIELYNPYNTPITMNNWQAGIINRQNPGVYPAMSLTPVAANALLYTEMFPENTAPLPSDATNVASPALTENQNAIAIPAHGYALLENYDASASHGGNADLVYDAKTRAPNCTIPTGAPWTGSGATNNTVDVYIPGLSKVIQDVAPVTGGEFVLLRPRRADGTYTQNITTNQTYDPLNDYNEGAPSPGTPNLYDLVPVDSYDFTGFQTTAITPYTAWSYLRAKARITASLPSILDPTSAPMPELLSPANTQAPTRNNSVVRASPLLPNGEQRLPRWEHPPQTSDPYTRHRLRQAIWTYRRYQSKSITRECPDQTQR